MTTTQKQFHVMRGDVQNGMNVRMENGDILELVDRGNYWNIVKGNETVATSLQSAHEVACFIYQY